MRRPSLVASVVLATVVSLSSCSLVDQLVGEETDTEQTPVETTETATPDEPEGDMEVVTPEEGAVPTCDTMYSAGQVAAFEEEERELAGDQSGGGYNWGSVNTELVALLEQVRADLRVSCTWYLPASESGSTTTVAIIPTEQADQVAAILGEEAGSSESLGEGTLYKLDQTSSNISGEFVANETHFLVSTPCPSSLAETSCSMWITSTFSFGSSETLTRDAAEVQGKL